MITATIDRIDQSGDSTISVMVRFEGGKEPTQKPYIFDFNEDITKEVIKLRIKDDLLKMNSISDKVTNLQVLVGKTL